MRIAVLHSNANYLTGLRLPLMQSFHDLGYAVTAMAPNMSPGHAEKLSRHGIGSLRYPINPTGLNPVVDILNVIKLALILRRAKVDIVLTNTAKPVVFGTFSSVLAGVPKRYALVSGLGYAFTDSEDADFSIKKAVIRWSMSWLYRVAFKFNSAVIFQNKDDVEELVSLKICAKERAFCVAGSGVDVDDFKYMERGPQKPSFVMVSRLIKEKGVRDYLEAARIVKRKVPESRFIIVGDVDSNPSALTRDELVRYVNEGTVDWPGNVENVKEWLACANVFVLPSYYREGVPRSILEAMSTGMAIITTDMPGCRDAVKHGKNGLLVPVRNPKALAEAMIMLAEDFSKVKKMGVVSRRMAVDKFDVNKVNMDMCEYMSLSSQRGQQ